MMPSRIFFIGPMGAGKTTIGSRLASTLNLDFYDSDRFIEEKEERSIADIFQFQGEAKFRDLEEFAIAKLTHMDNIVLATGGGAILREKNRAYLHERGLVIYLKTSVEMQLKRIKHDTKRPLLQTDDPKVRLENLMQQRASLYEATAHHIIETDEQSTQVVVKRILKAIHLD